MTTEQSEKGNIADFEDGGRRPLGRDADGL